MNDEVQQISAEPLQSPLQVRGDRMDWVLTVPIAGYRTTSQGNQRILLAILALHANNENDCLAHPRDCWPPELSVQDYIAALEGLVAQEMVILRTDNCTGQVFLHLALDKSNAFSNDGTTGSTIDVPR